LADLKLDELTGVHREIASIIGIENTIKLAEHFGKTGIYFRSLDGLIADKKRAYILTNFNGVNYPELARATELSDRWIREIIKRSKENKQPSLFDPTDTSND
jgi:Mor family transcriptional regulator